MEGRAEGGWVCMLVGEPMEAAAVRAKLEAFGVDAFVPDAQLRTIDPFLLGAGGMSAQVVVPAAQAARAREILALGIEDDAGRAELVARTDEPRGAFDDVSPSDPLVRLGRRVRWCGLLGGIPPLAIWGVYLAARYLAAVRDREPKPDGHGWTLVGAALSALWCAVAVAFWAGAL